MSPIRSSAHQDSLTFSSSRRGAAVTGLAVHAGARVAGLARANEVLVTSTVRMLALGSGITFADRGEHILKGIPDRWQRFAVEEI